MNTPQVAPYGSWKSPITSDLIVSATIGLVSIMRDRTDIYWTEQRPSEGGRNVIVRRGAGGEVIDVLPAPYNARTRVHEYGGGSCVVHDGTVYFSNYADQRVYRLDPGTEPQPITPAEKLRYADCVVDERRNRMICVHEDHTVAGREAVNTLVSFKLDGSDQAQQVLVSGNDFYSSPRLSPDGSQLAWLTWNHPNMPWDGTELWVGKLHEDQSISDRVRIVGGISESVVQPEWSPEGTLYFVSDRTGWWNLYRCRGRKVEPICPMDAEFGEPQWVFGNALYGFDSESRIICSYAKDGKWYLASIDTVTGELNTVEIPYSAISRIQTGGGRVVLIAASSTEPTSIVSLDLATRDLEVLRRSRELTVDAGYLSAPRAIEFPTEQSLTAYGIFYPPQNRDYVGPADEKPPLLVMSHGGPTSATSTSLRYATQYWTSRGIAVLDVNYGGSSGYGREYRERLKGQWGIVDVDDCVNGARYLVEAGAVDGNRLAIRGGSAGGYTTLCALTFRDAFKAGASHYGISDLEALAKDTHKFESRYLDGLIGPYPERRDLYVERSPIHFTDRLACPMILFQGLEDKVVPPKQAEEMFEAMRAKGLPVTYLTFEGEQHSFRKAENIKRVLEAELYFYSKVFKFELADPVEPIEIENI